MASTVNRTILAHCRVVGRSSMYNVHSHTPYRAYVNVVGSHFQRSNGPMPVSCSNRAPLLSNFLYELYDVLLAFMLSTRVGMHTRTCVYICHLSIWLPSRYIKINSADYSGVGFVSKCSAVHYY